MLAMFPNSNQEIDPWFAIYNRQEFRHITAKKFRQVGDQNPTAVIRKRD